MENLRDLELSEMIEISGGTNVAYEVGYAVGRFIKKLSVLKFITEII
jgi:hypothetical protein